MKRFRDSILSLNGLYFLIFSVVLGIYLIVMPRFVDDYWYMFNLTEWLKQQGDYNPNGKVDLVNYPFPWAEIFETWKDHYLIDNSRLCNVLVVFFLLIPKWIGSSIAVFAWMYTMASSFKLSGINFKKSAIVLMGIILWALFIPWPSHLGWLDYQFNYVLSSALSLCLVGLWFSIDKKFQFKRQLKGIKKFITLFLYFLISLIVGLWHEGFSLPIFVGFLFLVVCYNRFRNSYCYLILLGLAIGIIFLAIAPGTQVRMEATDLIPIPLYIKIFKTIIFNIPYWIFIVVLACVIYSHGLISVMQKKLIGFCVISGIIPLFMGLATFAVARVYWWTQLVSILGLMILCQNYYNHYWHKYRIKNLMWLIPLAMFALARFIYMDYYAFKTRGAVHDAIITYQKNPEKSIFEDVITNNEIPFYCVMMQDVVLLKDYQVNIAHFLETWSGKRNFAIIPSELKYVTAKSGRELDGPLDAREIDGLVFIPERNYNQDKLYAEELFSIDFGKWNKEVTGCIFKFTSEADGQSYYFINLRTPWPERNIFDIKGIELIPEN